MACMPLKEALQTWKTAIEPQWRETNKMTNPHLKWEFIETDEKGFFIKRAKILGGWLVWAAESELPEEDDAYAPTRAAGLTFIPDREHEWDGNSLP